MYEITNWQSQYLVDSNDIPKITLESCVLNEDFLKQFNQNQDVESDCIDIKFDSRLKKADKYDYGFAVFSGILSYIVSDYFKDFKKEQDFQALIKTVFVAFKVDGINYDDKIEKCLSKVEDNVKHADDYKECVEDFCEELNYRGLGISIVEAMFNKKIGLDADGNLTIEDLPGEPEGEISQRIIKGAVNWFITQASIYAKNGKYKKEVKVWNKGIKQVQEIIKEFSNCAFKDNHFEKGELTNWFMKRIMNQPINNLNRDSVSVTLNALLVRSYVHIRNFIEQVKEHHVTSLKGLEIINFDRIDNSRVIARLDTVSTGIFTSLDVASAVAVTKIELKEEKDIMQAVRVFAANINVANCVRFTIVLREDWNNIKEDVHDALHKAKIVEVKQHKEMSVEDLNDYFTLNKQATRILYSLELHMIEEDIQKTKESKDQILKNEWKDKWIETTEESVFMGKVFEKDPEKVYKLLLTEASVKKNPMWLYNIAIELSLFKPYYAIDEDEKRYKKLKLSYKSYLKDIFCSCQNIVEYKDISDIEKIYKKYCDYLDNSGIKKIGIAGGVVAVGVLTGGAAYVFAPQLAVALFGGAFPALHGAALTSACLAMAGGGSLAVGGLGMSGGAMIIAGGGALVGLGTTSSASLLLSSPKFVRSDSAKLLTKCDSILIKKLNMVDEVMAIQESTSDSIHKHKMELEYLKNIVNPSDECKKEIKELSKSIDYTERTNSALEKMLPKEK